MTEENNRNARTNMKHALGLWLAVLLCFLVTAGAQAAQSRVECARQPEALLHLLKPEEQAKAVAVVEKFMQLDWKDGRGQLPNPHDYYEPLIVEKPFNQMSGEEALIRSYRIVSACTYMREVYQIQVLLDIAGIRVSEPRLNRNGTITAFERPQTVYDTKLGGAQSPLEGATLVAEYSSLHWKLYRPPTRLHMLFLMVVKHKDSKDWRIYHGDRLRSHVGIREQIPYLQKWRNRISRSLSKCADSKGLLGKEECDDIRGEDEESKRYFHDVETLIPLPQGE
ncbi:MAG: hypothetical protein K8H84_13555 [Sulfuricella denitrificans]|nr:hypothetical protein [Sulfuricella denitrificans]